MVSNPVFSFTLEIKQLWCSDEKGLFLAIANLDQFAALVISVPFFKGNGSGI